MQRACQAPQHSYCRAGENIMLVMIVQIMRSCWYLNMIFKLMLAVHAVITIHAIFTIESFGWVDCKNIVHMMINFKKMLSWIWCIDLLAVHCHDAVQGFKLENIVGSSCSNIYKVAFTVCCTVCPCFLAYD